MSVCKGLKIKFKICIFCEKILKCSKTLKKLPKNCQKMQNKFSNYHSKIYVTDL